MTVSRDDAVQAVIDGQMFVYSDILTALAAGATAYVSIATGLQPVMIDRRSYGTALKDVTICLYENATATGGALLAGTNRDRTMTGVTMPEPQTVRTGVTPGALPAPLFALRLLDSNVLTAFGDGNDDKIRLARSMNYVLSITNNDATAGDFAWSYLVRACPN